MEEYAGLDVSKEETNFCVMDDAGRILAERPDLRPMIEPLLASAKALKIQIKRLDEDVRLEAKASRPAGYW